MRKQQNAHSQHRNRLAKKKKKEISQRERSTKSAGENTYRIAEESHIGYPEIRKRREYETEQTLCRQPRDVLNQRHRVQRVRSLRPGAHVRDDSLCRRRRARSKREEKRGYSGHPWVSQGKERARGAITYRDKCAISPSQRPRGSSTRRRRAATSAEIRGRRGTRCDPPACCALAA